MVMPKPFFQVHEALIQLRLAEEPPMVEDMMLPDDECRVVRDINKWAGKVHTRSGGNI